MSQIASTLAATQPSGLLEGERLSKADPTNPQLENALDVREAFSSFVGETFFQQMIKAMRTSVGKPAYFHGGQAEEIFRSQLDQTMGEEMTKASAEKISEPMFKLQFPKLAEVIAKYENHQQTATPSGKETFDQQF